MPVSATNLIQGPATIYGATFGATEPAAITDAFGVGWTDLGGTKEGITLNIEQTYSDLTVDQIIDVVDRRRTARMVSIGTSLAEATLANLALAISNTAPTANILELDNGLNAFKPAYGAYAFDGIAPGGFRRRVILRKTLGTGNVAMAYTKDGQTVIPTTFQGQWVSASISMLKIQDATS